MTAERNRPEQFTLEQVAQSAKEVILRDGKHLPTLIALGSLHNVVTRFSQMPDTHKGRAVMMHRTGSVIAEAGEVGDLQKVYFVVEAWMNTAREDGTFDLPPSKDPNRIEVLIVDSMDVQENEGDLIILEMVRDAQGKLTDLIEAAIPGAKDEISARSPLLEAFVDGFRTTMRRKAN